MRIFMIFTLTTICVATALGQAPGANVRPDAQGATGAHTNRPATPQQLTESQINDLNKQIQELRNEISELKSRPSGQARVPVVITPDDEFPQPPDEKADGFAQTQAALDSLWTAIDLIRRDLKKLNGR